MQVAVGSANGYPAAWTSANGGSSWTRANGQTPAVLDRPGVQQLTSVTFGADGWLAVGGVIAVAAQHPVVLRSGNGSVWIAADREAAFGQPGLFTEQATAGPAGYVIVGYQAVAGRTIAAAWCSAGLTGWHRAGTPSGASGQMRAVTAGPRGFVAVGADGNAAAAWTSPNGAGLDPAERPAAGRRHPGRAPARREQRPHRGRGGHRAHHRRPAAAVRGELGRRRRHLDRVGPAGPAGPRVRHRADRAHRDWGGTGAGPGPGPAASSSPPARSAAPPVTRTWWCGPRPADRPGRRPPRPGRA